MLIGLFVTTLDALIVSVALPSIRHDLGGGITGQQWVVDGYFDAEGPAYLLAWIRIPDGTWGAQIAWVSIERGDGAWVVRSQTVMADVITKMDG